MSEQYGGPWSSPTDGPSPSYPQAQYTTPPPGPAPHSGHPYQGHPYPGYVPTPPPPLRSDYALWGKRVLANLIDSIPSLIGAIVFNVGYFQFILASVRSAGDIDFSSGGPAMVVGVVLMLVGTAWAIYNRWITAGRTGQSLGKRVMKIVLIGEDTQAPIGALNAFVRDLVHTLDGFAYVGYLWPLWDERRQTFSDKIMKTVVITAPGQPG